MNVCVDGGKKEQCAVLRECSSVLIGIVNNEKEREPSLNEVE